VLAITERGRIRKVRAGQKKKRGKGAQKRVGGNSEKLASRKKIVQALELKGGRRVDGEKKPDRGGENKVGVRSREAQRTRRKNLKATPKTQKRHRHRKGEEIKVMR